MRPPSGRVLSPFFDRPRVNGRWAARRGGWHEPFYFGFLSSRPCPPPPTAAATAKADDKASGLAVARSPINREGLPASTPVPDFTLLDLAGEQRTLAEFRGKLRTGDETP